MRVELRAEARIDLVDRAEFYENISPGLSERFLDCVRQDLALLGSTAGMHELYRGFHRALVKRFPFAIYYLVTSDAVHVVAVLDCRVAPKSTDERL
ncbi:hypothetical protein CEE69_01795 [Rhodopirellula bahusiensis]|uniref:Plasmid stabilization protein n=1 Tax=Rhodopirellula bahusiensis TaxID=2014065 RepID=A0A2G1WDJ1_9BACT|nr:hypothetical protein CEE69_01795 [Rhodopirellula bahusiensis]